jgi:hypothetical protein
MIWLVFSLSCINVIPSAEDSPPTVEILRPASGQTFTGPFTVCARITDEEPLNHLERRLTVDGDELADDSVFGLCEGGNSGLIITLADGTWTLELEATDPAGQTGSDTIDVTANTPVIEDDDTGDDKDTDG